MSIIYPNKNIDLTSFRSTWNNTLDEIYADASDKWWLELKEFETVMPDLEKVELMCKEYPALAKAFENFKIVYNLVKDDYEAKNG